MRSSRGVRMLGGAAAAALSMAVLAGCGSLASEPTASPTVTVAPSVTPSAPAATPASPSPVPTDTVTESAAPSAASTTTTGGSASDPGRPSGQCADGDLGVQVAIADGGGGAGSEAYDVLFTNTGGSSCELRGTPGVSVVGKGNGTQLGEPADRSQTGVKTVRLAVGETVAAPLSIVNIATGGGPIGSDCAVAKGDGYRVYPPHSKRAFLVKDADAVACTSASVFMTVGPVARFAG